MEIPTNIQRIKQDDLDLALDWRLRVREALETYLQRGYLVTDFTVIRQGDACRNGYVLTLASGLNRNAEGDIPSQKGVT
jgi:predicted GNAT superfamily acetyltransferase